MPKKKITIKELTRDFYLNIYKNKYWLLIFTFCFVYWAYLIFHTKMIVVFDSIDYENTGRLIYQNGWLNFFQTGPHREPLYPALIALSMAWADFLSLDYQLILKIFQVVFLFLTQLLLIVILRRLNILNGIIKATVFYFGISPAIINAAFSVYYEIVVFPFVAAAVLLAGSLWSDIHQKKRYYSIFWKTILFGICFSLLVFGRGVFQIVFYFFILSFCFFAIFFLFKRQRAVFQRALIFILAAFTIFYSTVHYIKTMNLRHNGEYVFCASHLNIFLASAYKRSKPVTFQIIAAHIASIPGNGICRMFFSRKECDYADWYGIDTSQAGQRMTTIPKDCQERKVAWLVLKEAISHPFHYIFFSGVEALKMPFWESTKIGYVNYTEFLTKLYNHLFMRFGLRLCIGIITTLSLVFVTFNLWGPKRRCFSMKYSPYSRITLFFVWLMISAYIFCYSSCCVLVRYTLPIASMYIVCISYTINEIFCRKNFNE